MSTDGSLSPLTHASQTKGCFICYAALNSFSIICLFIFLSLSFFLDDEFFFVEPDAKLSKVAPDGWKDDPRKKKSDVNFNLFLRIKFFQDDVSLIQ